MKRRAGIIPYFIFPTGTDVKFLFGIDYDTGSIMDFGGHIEHDPSQKNKLDLTYFDAAKRELKEESLGLLETNHPEHSLISFSDDTTILFFVEFTYDPDLIEKYNIKYQREIIKAREFNSSIPEHSSIIYLTKEEILKRTDNFYPVIQNLIRSAISGLDLLQ